MRNLDRARSIRLSRIKRRAQGNVSDQFLVANRKLLDDGVGAVQHQRIGIARNMKFEAVALVGANLDGGLVAGCRECMCELADASAEK